MKGLTDIPGIRVGHVSDYDALTGCTAILCEQGAVGGVDIRGSASGTQEIADARAPATWPPQVHGILLAGGSAFGLEAAVRRAALPGAARRGLRLRRPAHSHRARGDPFRSRNRQAECSPQSGDGRSRRRRRHRRPGRGRVRGRGHGRHRGQALRHEAGHEIGHRIVHGDAPRRRAGGRAWWR